MDSIPLTFFTDSDFADFKGMLDADMKRLQSEGWVQEKTGRSIHGRR